VDLELALAMLLLENDQAPNRSKRRWAWATMMDS